ncbi:MAG TPA: hypothetical protein PLM79_09965 [Syntrophobacteraceae bacterium]|nr:hypothetical protein [Syntrophobacteraceae bacterium]
MMEKAVPGRMNVQLALLSGLILLVVLVVAGLWYKDKEHDLESVFHSTLQKQEIVSRMRISLLKSAELEKAAVMADTDPLSRSLADQSLQAAEETDRQRRELNRLIEHDSLAEEVALLKEFDHCWSQSRKIDAVLLDFAVENTNLKAARLSFTTAGKTLELFQQRLTDFLGSMASNERECRGGKAVFAALAAGFKIQYLHAPHIAAANDEQMDAIEKEIEASREGVKSSLKELEGLASEENRELLRPAASAFAEFEAVCAEVVRLSRQNSNIRSLELSLGRKRKITSECDEILEGLQAVIRKRTPDATR